jgi:antitoxin component YwqK of YwqJK toxin-antitoxin module
MKKTIISIMLLAFASSLHAAFLIVGAQNDAETAFFQGTTKVASWSYNADGTTDAQGTTINGEIKIYYGSGDKSRVAVFKVRENKIEDGSYTWTYKTGEPAGEESYADGKKDGPFKFLYKSGKTSKEGSYKAGKKDGVFKLYFENGSLAEEGAYKDGLKNGEFTLYYQTGEAKERYTCVNDRRHGEYQQFYQSGTLKMEGKYKNNLKEGNFMKYFESGEDAGIQVYKKGVLVSGDADDINEIEVTTPLE